MLPEDCISLILDYVAQLHYTDTMKKVHGILLHSSSRDATSTLFRNHSYLWNDVEQDSGWVHFLRDRKCIVIENENCVRCGEFRESVCRRCKCPEFVDLVDELLPNPY